MTDTSQAANLGFEAKLFLTADKLRGSMDASEYKHVALGLVFLKYISDAFNTVFEKLQADEYADEEDAEEYLAERTFWVPKEARWGYLQANAKQPTIGKLVDAAMLAIEKSNTSLKGVLPTNYAREALNKTMLGELIDLISTIGMNEESDKSKDILGRVYEYFLGGFAGAEGKRGGEFYTPRSVVRVLTEMLEPYKGRVYDPCCGSGGMFVQSEKFVAEHGGSIGYIRVYGQEMKLTKTVIKDAQSTGKRYKIQDQTLPGFFLRVEPSGGKTFYVRYRTPEKIQRNFKIGSPKNLTPDQARARAREVLGAVAQGTDPGADRQAKRSAPTLKDLAVRYMAEHGNKKKLGHNDEILWRRHLLPTMGMARVALLSREQVRRFHTNHPSPNTANRAVEVLSKALDLAKEWAWTDGENPCVGINAFPETKRKRYLSSEELERLRVVLNNWTDREPEAVRWRFAQMIRLLLLTGARTGNIMRGRWEWLSWNRRTLTVPAEQHKQCTLISTHKAPMLRRLSLGLLASAISLVSLPAIAQEGSAEDLGVMNISLADVVKPTIGFQGSLQGAGTPNQAGIGGFLPLSVGENSVWFLDALVNANFADREGYSSIIHTDVGGGYSTSTRLGYRWLNSDRSWMFGLNGGYDSRSLKSGGTDTGISVTNKKTVGFQQIALNAEAVSNGWTLNGYVLIPVGDVEQKLNSFYQGGALNTYGLDAGYFITPAVKASAGYYYQHRDQEHVDGYGVRGRLAYEMTSGVTAGLNISYDKVFDTRVSADIKVRFGGASTTAQRKEVTELSVINALTSTPQNRDVRVHDWGKYCVYFLEKLFYCTFYHDTWYPLCDSYPDDKFESGECEGVRSKKQRVGSREPNNRE